MNGRICPLIAPVPVHCFSITSMATNSHHRVIMGKTTSSRFLDFFDRILFLLAGDDDIHKSLDEFEIWPDSTKDYGVSCP